MDVRFHLNQLLYSVGLILMILLIESVQVKALVDNDGFLKDLPQLFLLTPFDRAGQ